MHSIPLSEIAIICEDEFLGCIDWNSPFYIEPFTIIKLMVYKNITNHVVHILFYPFFPFSSIFFFPWDDNGHGMDCLGKHL